mmetsp:Transcript_5227/g.6015  ORF Transcript_5227/g.6015 Transcript_5227/m.6015 type:complete len:214 (-) Transcript_5227:1176-1817(-)
MLLPLFVGCIILFNRLQAHVVRAEYIFHSRVTTSEQCTDSVSHSFENEDGIEVDCTWLTENPSEEAVRVATYCLRPDVQYQCTHTCYACDEECADNPTYEFRQLILNVFRNCTWITESPDLIEVKREGYCDEIGLFCPDACGFCPVREVTTSPSFAPSVVASNSVSDNTTNLSSKPSSSPSKSTKKNTKKSKSSKSKKSKASNSGKGKSKKRR